MPRNSDNNTIVKTLFATNIPCSPPDTDISVILQYNYNGRTSYTINLLLESDPAALQALDFIFIREDNHSFFEVIPAKKIVSQYTCELVYGMNLVYKIRKCIS